jgi:dipeptidyl aminopeptidase/acylaminoacyl peptidase
MKHLLEQLPLSKIEEIKNEYPAFSFFYTSDNLKVKGYIILPKEIKDKHPLIIVNRGGTGEYGKITDEYIKRFSFFAESGYVTVLSQYRGVDGGEGIDRMGGDDIFDVINLYDLISRLPFVDSQNVGMWGVSRGGMMTFQILARVSWVKAAVVVAPIINEVHMAEWRTGWKQHQIDMYGGSYAEQVKRSVAFWPEQIPKIPILIFHGDKDDKTNHEDSLKIHATFKELGIPSEIVIFNNESHLISQKTVQQSLNWFQEYLK